MAICGCVCSWETQYTATVFPLNRKKEKTLARLIEVTGRQALDHHYRGNTVYTWSWTVGGRVVPVLNSFCGSERYVYVLPILQYQ